MSVDSTPVGSVVIALKEERDLPPNFDTRDDGHWLGRHFQRQRCRRRIPCSVCRFSATQSVFLPSRKKTVSTMEMKPITKGAAGTRTPTLVVSFGRETADKVWSFKACWQDNHASTN